jgi:hypothetical protein
MPLVLEVKMRSLTSNFPILSSSLPTLVLKSFKTSSGLVSSLPISASSASVVVAVIVLGAIPQSSIPDPLLAMVCELGVGRGVLDREWKDGGGG